MRNERVTKEVLRVRLYEEGSTGADQGSMGFLEYENGDFSRVVAKDNLLSESCTIS
jgi:hypothetical protein